MTQEETTQEEMTITQEETNEETNEETTQALDDVGHFNNFYNEATIKSQFGHLITDMRCSTTKNVPKDTKKILASQT